MTTTAKRPATPIRTLVVDDTPMMRRIIRQILEDDNRIEVIGTAANGHEGLEKVEQLKPDVVTLDIDMPVMNGLTAIKHIMVRHQVPTVIVSSLIQDGFFAFEALRLGVVDFVPKPSRVATGDWGEQERLLRQRVQLGASMEINKMRRVRRPRRTASKGPRSTAAPNALAVMGTTLAGPNTTMRIVTGLPKGIPAAVIALQEIHPQILEPFSIHFNSISDLDVIPVNESRVLYSESVYVASTFMGVRLERDEDGGQWIIRPARKPVQEPINELFTSAAAHYGANVCAVLLTGVGTDGATGLRSVKEQGGLTIAQDQATTVYPNIIEHAIGQNVVDEILADRIIAQRLIKWLEDLPQVV